MTAVSPVAGEVKGQLTSPPVKLTINVEKLWETVMESIRGNGEGPLAAGLTPLVERLRGSAPEELAGKQASEELGLRSVIPSKRFYTLGYILTATETVRQVLLWLAVLANSLGNIFHELISSTLCRRAWYREPSARRGFLGTGRPSSTPLRAFTHPIGSGVKGLPP